LLCWYKSTNSDAAGAVFFFTAGTLVTLGVTSVTNTDMLSSTTQASVRRLVHLVRQPIATDSENSRRGLEKEYPPPSQSVTDMRSEDLDRPAHLYTATPATAERLYTFDDLKTRDMLAAHVLSRHGGLTKLLYAN
jgi:hypothetical protein